MTIVSITNGRFTIPKNIRQKLGLRNGGKANVYLKNGNVIVKPVRQSRLDK